MSAGVIVAAFVFFVAFHWVAAQPPFDPALASLNNWNYWLRLFIWTTLGHKFLGQHFPWRPMLSALERYQASVTSVRHAQADVDRCLASNDHGASWHLELARTSLAQFERERDEARTQVDAYGYRAGFSRS